MSLFIEISENYKVKSAQFQKLWTAISYLRKYSLEEVHSKSSATVSDEYSVCYSAVTSHSLDFYMDVEVDLH